MNLPSSPSRRRLLLVAGSALAAGCATAPEKPATVKAPVFYPAPPDPPRVQHLVTLTSARDLRRDQGGLADFVLGKEGSEDRLLRPYGAALFDGRLYVADSRAAGLAVFDLAAGRFRVIEGTGAGRMQRPVNVTIDADGTKYVTDTARNQVLVYDRAEGFVAAFGEKEKFRPADAAIVGDRLYVTDLASNQVLVLDKRTGKPLFRFGKPGKDEDGALYQPTNLAVSPDGDLYVVETGNFRVSRFTSEGRFVRRFGEVGQVHGTFARPKGIAVDRAGRVYVGDAAFQNVQVFDSGGRVLMAFGQPPDKSEGLNLPAGISIDYDNVGVFRRYAAPGFDLEYVIVVVSQFAPDKVDVFGFGRMRGASYPADDVPAKKSGG